MNLTELIHHPERMNKETLYDLRSLLALHPYYQTARMLMLQNLYLLHDSTFDEELRKAAIYITDRKVIFNLVEAAHYKIRQDKQKQHRESSNEDRDRTFTLIDDFLESIPSDDHGDNKKRQPTTADATIDYVSYLLQTENKEDKTAQETPQLRGQSLIDDFIENEDGKIHLEEESREDEIAPEQYVPNDYEGSEEQEEYFTETLARIYIKQQRYDKALEIIKRLNLVYPKKNRYFADQIRFLEKLILNNNYKK